jgi:hypothetical protein
MTAFARTYVGAPDIPGGLTISDYRRSRPRRITRRRILLTGPRGRWLRPARGHAQAEVQDRPPEVTDSNTLARAEPRGAGSYSAG